MAAWRLITFYFRVDERRGSSLFPTLPLLDCVQKEYERTRSFTDTKYLGYAIENTLHHKVSPSKHAGECCDNHSRLLWKGPIHRLAGRRWQRFRCARSIDVRVSIGWTRRNGKFLSQQYDRVSWLCSLGRGHWNRFVARMA